MAFRDLSIKWKLILVILTISGTVLVLTSAVFLLYEWITFRQTVVQYLSTLAEIVADNSTAALAFRNESDATHILAALKAEQHIVAAGLYDQKGHLFASFSRGATEHAFPKTPQGPGYYFEENYLVFFQSVVEGGKRYGTLYLKTDLHTIQKQFYLYIVIALLVMGGSFLVAFALSHILQKQISHPILTLANIARMISTQANYSIRAPKKSNDEVGVLTEAFNYMLTQIQERDETLRENQERLNLALQAAGMGTWDWDLLHNTIRWDDHTHWLFGVKPDAFSGKYEDALHLIHPDDQKQIEQEVTKALAECSGYSSEFRVIWPDGSVRYLASRGRVYTDEQGRAVRMTGIYWDMTEHKLAEEELKRTAAKLARSNAELEQFAYVASHDLQEPLRGIAGCVQLLRQRYQGILDDRADQLITHTVEGVTRMQTLINDLLAYSRVGTRGKPLVPTDCATLVQDVLSNLRVAIEERGALVTTDPLPTVLADPTQLMQVLQNLLSNALKFCNRQPPVIHISAELQKDRWVFGVRDNGIGIEPQYFERIFQVFQRLHTRREYAGTGIGLAICKKIIERHGGHIWVESEPGKGSTFFFTIPVER